MDHMANEELNVMREMRSEIDNESNMSGSQSSFYKPQLFKPSSTPKSKPTKSNQKEKPLAILQGSPAKVGKAAFTKVADKEP